ncbi:hypothetical protein GW17_00045403 [Ensete ventricosum]|nr:hypothetical protein GW17_00045403 [Ensete ventricosum]
MVLLGLLTVVSEPRLFMLKIGFKLCVMRLNHIELFYVFLLSFRSEGNEERGSHPWAGCLQGWLLSDMAPYKSGRLRSSYLQGWSAANRATSKGSRLRPACKGWPPMSITIACRGGTCGHGARWRATQWQRRIPLSPT